MVRDMAYKFRYYPTVEQEELLARTFGTTRYVYNHFLEVRSVAWSEREERVRYGDTSAMLPDMKKEKPWIAEVSSVAVQQALRHLDNAYQRFFKKGAGHPRYKSRRDKQSAEFTKAAFRIRDGKVYLAKMKEPLDLVIHRDIDLNLVTTVTITKSPSGRYHASLRFQKEIEKLPELDTSVGVDVGITSFVTLDSGEKITSPKTDWKKLAREQRKLSRKQRGSNRHNRQRQKVARIHEKIVNRRLDFQHKLSTKLVRENQTIVVETLSVQQMLKNRHLSRHIAEASWSEFFRQLKYKAEWYGRELIEVDQWFPSTKTCSGCGHVLENLPLNKRAWKCPECLETHDRDINAAKNILAAGHAVSVRGGDEGKPLRFPVSVEARTVPLAGSPCL